MSFKDKCDQCGKFDYLKSQNGRCLCKNCLNKVKKNKQLSIYDFIRKEDA